MRAQKNEGRVLFIVSEGMFYTKKGSWSRDIQDARVFFDEGTALEWIGSLPAANGDYCVRLVEDPGTECEQTLATFYA